MGHPLKVHSKRKLIEHIQQLESRLVTLEDFVIAYVRKNGRIAVDRADMLALPPKSGVHMREDTQMARIICEYRDEKPGNDERSEADHPGGDG